MTIHTDSSEEPDYHPDHPASRYESIEEHAANELWVIEQEIHASGESATLNGYDISILPVIFQAMKLLPIEQREVIRRAVADEIQKQLEGAWR